MNQADPIQAAQKKTLMGAGIAALVLIVGLIGFGAGSGFFGMFGGRETGLDKGGAANPGLAKEAQAAPALIDPGTTTPNLPIEAKRMPQDILDWLEHLRKTEERRKALSTKQMGDLSVQMTYLTVGAGKKALEGLLRGDEEALENNPATEMADTTAKIREEWRELIAFFDSKRPPAECAPIYTAYSESLVETKEMVAEIGGIISGGLENSEAAISALNGLKGDSATRVSRPAGETDRLVAEICAKYDTRKWFSIEYDYGSGLLNQIGGTPGLAGSGSSPQPPPASVNQ